MDQIKKEEFQPKFLVSSILAGFIISILTVIAEISFAALIFSGDLSDYIGRGIGFRLLDERFPGTNKSLRILLE